MFYFSNNSLILCYSSCFVLYSHYGDSSSGEKLNGHQALESMSLLGELISPFKLNTFHDRHNY